MKHNFEVARPGKGIALTIAGADPTGGAGIQADLKTFRSMNVYGLAVITALTAQNTEGVEGIQEISSDFVSKQLEVLLNDVRPGACKTGMLYSAEIIRIVADQVKKHSLNKFVVDPVTLSSTGVPLAGNEMLSAMKDLLLPLSTVITPNIYEAALLTGIDIKDEEDIKKAAAGLKKLGPEFVIITDGHLKAKAIDLLFDGKEFLTLENEMLEGEYHGTGCVFSSVITAGLASGYDIRESFVKAKEFVWKAMKSAVSIGKGLKILDI